MTEDLNRYRHAMRTLADLEREIGGNQPSRGFHAQQPEPQYAAPQTNVRKEAPLRWNHPETLRRVGENEARFWGGLAEPVMDVAQDALSDVGQFFGNVKERSRRKQGLRNRYMPAIREANRNASAFMAQDDALRARRDEWVLGAEERTGALRADLADRVSPPTVTYTSRAPVDLSDEELLAELEAMERAQ